MEPGMWFQLNISSSDSVVVTVSFAQQSSGGSTKVPVFLPPEGSSFNQKVSISFTGTYFIDITNENSFPVTLWGNVLVQERELNYHMIYPYVVPGLLVMLGGASVLVFGISKGVKRPSRLKDLRKKKIKQ